MKVPENARERIKEIVSHLYDEAPDDVEWLAALALRALDYEAASGEVTEESVVIAALNAYYAAPAMGTSEDLMRRVVRAVAPSLVAAGWRKGLEEAAAWHEACAAEHEAGVHSIDGKPDPESRRARTHRHYAYHIRTIGRPA